MKKGQHLYESFIKGFDIWPKTKCLTKCLKFHQTIFVFAGALTTTWNLQELCKLVGTITLWKMFFLIHGCFIIAMIAFNKGLIGVKNSLPQNIPVKFKMSRELCIRVVKAHNQISRWKTKNSSEICKWTNSVQSKGKVEKWFSCKVLLSKGSRPNRVHLYQVRYQG